VVENKKVENMGLGTKWSRTKKNISGKGG